MAGNPEDGHIFISYSRTDSRFAHCLADDLHQAGFVTWMDETGLTPGTPNWENAIEDALRASSCLIVILSPDAKESKWVGLELAVAERLGKDIFPILARGDVNNAVPMRLELHQRVDAREDYGAALGSLVNVLPEPPRIFSRLPAEIEVVLHSPRATMRLGAVLTLIDFAQGDDAELANLAHERLQESAQNDPDKEVRKAAHRFFDEQKALRDASVERPQQAREIAPQAKKVLDNLTTLERGVLYRLSILCQEYRPDYLFEDYLFVSASYGQVVTPVELEIMIKHGWAEWVEQEAPGRKIRITDAGRKAAGC